MYCPQKGALLRIGLRDLPHPLTPRGLTINVISQLNNRVTSIEIFYTRSKDCSYHCTILLAVRQAMHASVGGVLVHFVPIFGSIAPTRALLAVLTRSPRALRPRTSLRVSTGSRNGWIGISRLKQGKPQSRVEAKQTNIAHAT